jgi:hypothetical protein
MHPHQDIESLPYVVEGDFLHADSLGNNGRLAFGAAQVMTFSHEVCESWNERLAPPCRRRTGFDLSGAPRVREDLSLAAWPHCASNDRFESP